MKKKIITFVKKPLGYISLAIILIVIIFLIVRGSGNKIETVTVQAGEFSQHVSVAGKVVAAENVDLGFDQSGRVAAIYGSVGDVVTAGNVIASIENGDVRADLLQKQAALQAQQAKLAALVRGTRPEQLAVAQSGVASAQSALDQAKQALSDDIKDAYTRSDDAVHSKADQLFTNGSSNNPQLAVSINDSQLKNTIESGRISMERLLTNFPTDSTSAKDTLSKIKAFLSNLSTAVSSLTTSNNPNLSQTTIDKYKTDIASARTNVDTAVSNLTSAESQLKASETALVTAENQLKLEQAGTAQEDIDAQKAQVASAQADVDSVRSRLAKTVVVAPFTGIITRMDAKVGETVSPGASKISMISSANFQIESYVPEVNVSSVKVGNQASSTLDAYGTSEVFPVVVASIDPAETIRDGVSTYKIKLQFLKKDDRVKSGMTANVEILTDDRSNVVTIPPKALTKKNGKNFVTVKEGSDTYQVEVTTGGISSSGQIEILSGLSIGEQVVIPNQN